MSGLLYKDFLCIRGKWLILLLTGQFALLTILRFVHREGGEGELLIFSLYVLPVVAAMCYVLFGMDAALFRHEKGEKERRYCFSLPVSKRDYVAEKYLFVLLALYSVISLGILEGMVCRLFTGEGAVQSAFGMEAGVAAAGVGVLSMLLQAMIPVMAGAGLVICAVEFAFLFTLGAERGLRIKTGVLCLLFFAGAAYMLFGDLSIADRWNLAAMAVYFEEHPAAGALLNVLAPVFGGGAYALSYRFSVRSFEKREDWLDA